MTGHELFRKINFENEDVRNNVNFQSHNKEDEDLCEEEIQALEEELFDDPV